VPTLRCWPEFRSDYRIDNFTPGAVKLFDDILRSAAAYNAAVYDVRPIARAMLKDEIHAAVSKIESNPEYQQWKGEHNEQIAQHIPVAEMLDTDIHRTYGFVALGSSYSTPMDEAWSHGWLEVLPIHQPATLGWLLAKEPGEAAQCVHDGLQGSLVVAPVTWFAEIFKPVCERLIDEAGIQEVYRTAKGLHQDLLNGEQSVAQALQYIRDRYEGGEPPL
jgi:hypothetical protein